MVFLGRNTLTNKDLDATNKKIKKVTWHSCWSKSITNLDQLIFPWEGWHLVLALFAGIYYMQISFVNVSEYEMYFLAVFDKQ